MVSVTTGWPAFSRAAIAGSAGSVASLVCTKSLSGPYTSGRPSGSPSTGMMPRPSLPVLSARSCSSQYPKVATAGDMTRVSLSWPRAASRPMAPPSQTPGFLSTGTVASQALAISCARSSSSRTSRPISAPGTSPKYESAE